MSLVAPFLHNLAFALIGQCQNGIEFLKFHSIIGQRNQLKQFEQFKVVRFSKIYKSVCLAGRFGCTLHSFNAHNFVAINSNIMKPGQ